MEMLLNGPLEALYISSHLRISILYINKNKVQNGFCKITNTYMCVINEPVEQVSATKIFTAQFQDIDESTPLQLTIYSNKIELKNNKSNAMIVPFPGQYIDYKLPMNDIKAVHQVEELFAIAKSCFPVAQSMSNSVASEEKLKVDKVGSYSVSVATCLEDLTKFDREVFQINPDVLNLFEEEYGSSSDVEWSFLIFQLDVSKAYHPFGYIHQAISKTKTHIPTLHYHGSQQEEHEDLNIANDWDHTIVILSQEDVKSKPEFEIGMSTHSADLKNENQFRIRTCSIPDFQARKFYQFFKKWIPNYPGLTASPFRQLSTIKVKGEAINGDISEAENLQGVAYRCSVCSNVDFCHDCISTGRHLDEEEFQNIVQHSIKHPLILINL